MHDCAPGGKGEPGAPRVEHRYYESRWEKLARHRTANLEKKTILAPKLNTSERPKLTSKVFNEPLIRPRKEIHFYITLKKKLSGLYSGHKICRLFSKVYLDKPGKFGTIVEIKIKENFVTLS